MSRAYTASRYIGRESTTGDRPRSAAWSPFHAHKSAHRIKGARAMIAKRHAEIAQIKKALKTAETPKVQRILTQRLLASTNNLASWNAYIIDADRVKSAVITIGA
jgi:hypothetical protein